MGASPRSLHAICLFPFSFLGKIGRKGLHPSFFYLRFRKLKSTSASLLNSQHCRGSSAWESARLNALAFEGEAEDRVVAGSNPALGTMMDYWHKPKTLHFLFLKNFRPSKARRMPSQTCSSRQIHSCRKNVKSLFPKTRYTRL